MMTDLVPEYTFEGDEIFALHEGQVIASGSDMEAVESDATKYLEEKTHKFEVTEKAAQKSSATHIVTPNGVKGQILARTANIYGGEEISVRLANGQFATYQTHPELEDNAQYVNENNQKTAGTTPLAKLASRLDADFDHDKESLQARAEELRDIAIQAHHLITAGAPYSIATELHALRSSAEVEARQVKEALDHLEAVDAETFAPPSPQYQVAEQADIGAAGNDWLDVVAQDMIAESEAVDHDQLLGEGPALFVADLDNGALMETGVTREMALSYVTSKTAGFAGEEVENYRQEFLARVERARVSELSARKDNKKEAAAETEAQIDAPDEAIFL